MVTERNKMDSWIRSCKLQLQCGKSKNFHVTME